MFKLSDFEGELNKVRAFLVEYLAEKGLDVRDGRKIKCINPDHDDKHPSMSVFTGASGEPVAHCFSCGFSADIFTAAHILDNKPIAGSGFIEDNVGFLAKKFGIELATRPLTEEEVYEYNTYEAYKLVADYISASPFNALVKEELARRKWDENFVRKLKIGTCDDFEKMRNILKMSGFSARFLDEVDLSNKSIFSENNLIFTISDDYGRPVGFAARNLKYDGVRDENQRLINGSKFSNTKTTGVKCNIYRKSERLYLLNEAKHHTPPLYIVEGYGDAVTLHANGLTNAVAIGSLELSEHHLNTCRKNGIYDVIICLDGDKSGQEKARKLLDEVLKTVHDLRIRFIFMPFDEGEKNDPDSYVREYGIAQFLDLPKVEPFEWRLMEFEMDENADPETICFSMIPIILNEPSPIKREKMVRELSEFTGYGEKVIRDELDKISKSDAAILAQKREGAISDLMSKINNRTETFEIALQKALDDLYEIQKDSVGSSLDFTSIINNVLSIKQYQETEDLHSALNFGPNMRTMQAALSGDIRQKMILLGGTANTGKTTKFVNLSYNLAAYNEDVMSIVLTIDDSARDFIPRLVTYDMVLRNLDNELFNYININKVATPFLYKDAFEYDAILEEREKSYQNVIKLINDGKYVVLDSNHGRTYEFISSVIRNYRDKYPERRIVFFLDNFHLVKANGEGREKYKALSGEIKNLCVKYDCTVITTVEYRKIPRGQKPGNQDLAETNALDYDSNATIHLYNETHDLRDKSNKYFLAPNGNKYPIIEEDFGKNKINSFKGTIYYKFYPDKAYYREISEQEVRDLESANAMTNYANSADSREEDEE